MARYVKGGYLCICQDNYLDAKVAYDARWLYWEKSTDVLQKEVIEFMEWYVNSKEHSQITVSLRKGIISDNNGQSVICVYSNDEIKNQVRDVFEKNLDFIPKLYKSNRQSDIDLSEGGWLNKYYQLGALYEKSKTNPHNISFEDVSLIPALWYELYERIRLETDHNVLAEMHYAGLIRGLEHLAGSALISGVPAKRNWKESFEEKIRKNGIVIEDNLLGIRIDKLDSVSSIKSLKEILSKYDLELFVEILNDKPAVFDENRDKYIERAYGFFIGIAGSYAKEALDIMYRSLFH